MEVTTTMKKENRVRVSCNKETCDLCLFIDSHKDMEKGNPCGWINEFFQESDLLTTLGISPILHENKKRTIYKEGQKIEYEVIFMRKHIPYKFHGNASRLTMAMSMAMKMAIEYLVYTTHTWRDGVDAQMDSTQSTEQGPSTLEGEKSFGTIMTTAVPVTETLENTPSKQEIFEMTKLTTGEEAVTFDVLQSRWTRLDTFTWSLAENKRGTVLREYKLPEAFYSNAQAPNRLPFEQFVFCRPNYEIKIKINGHKFAAGRLLVSYFYEPSALGFTKVQGQLSDELGPLSWRDAILRDHAFIDIAESNEVVMEIPFRNKQVWINTLPGNELATQGAWNVSVYIYIISSIRTASDAPNSFPITVYARLKNTQFTGIRNNVSVVTADAQMGMGSSALDAAKNFLEGTRNVPGLGGIFNAAGKITGNIAMGITRMVANDEHTKAVEERLRYLGVIGNRDKPTNWLQPNDLRPSVAGNLAIGKGAEMVLPMRLDPYATCAQPQDLIFGLPNNSVFDMLRVWNFRSSFLWKQSDNEASPIHTFSVVPYLPGTGAPNSLAKNALQMDGIMQCYTYWTGSMEFRFDIVGTQFHNGILVVCWIPEGTDTYDMVTGMSSYYKIFDLREDRSFTFTVPYISSTIMHLSDYHSDRSNRGIPPLSKGFVRIFVQNKLTPIQSVSTELDVLVFCRVGQDFQANYIKNNNAIQENNFDASLRFLDGSYPIKAKEVKADAQMDTGDKENPDRTPNFGLISPLATVIQPSEDHMSIKDIMRRWTAIYQQKEAVQLWEESLCTATPDAPSWWQARFAVSEFACSPWQYYSMDQSSAREGSLQAYLARQFRWGRGSLRFMIVFYTADDPILLGWRRGVDEKKDSPKDCTITKTSNYYYPLQENQRWAESITVTHIPQGSTMMLDPSDLIIDAKDTNNFIYETLAANGVTYATQYVNMKINNTIKIEVPFHGIFNYLDMQAGLKNSTSDAEAPAPYYLDLMARSLGSIQMVGDGLFRYNVYMAAGDDWEFSQYCPWGAHRRILNVHPTPAGSLSLVYIRKDQHRSKVSTHADSQMPKQQGETWEEYQRRVENERYIRRVNASQPKEIRDKKSKREVDMQCPPSRNSDQELERMQAAARQREEQRLAALRERDRFQEEMRRRADRQAHHDYQRQRRSGNRQMDAIPSTSAFPNDEDFGIIGDAPSAFGMTKLSGFCSAATKRVSDTLNSIGNPIKVAYNLPKRCDSTLMRWESLGQKAELAFESLKNMAQSIADTVVQKCSWLTSVSSIFSSVLHFLQALIRPTWQGFVLAFLGILTNLQLFSQEIIIKLTGFFLKLKGTDVPSEDHPSEGQNADAQCEHNTCVRCASRDDCMRTCNYCASLKRRKDYFFSDEEAGNLIALLFAGLSAYWQYKGTPPDTAYYVKMLRVSTTFWLTARGAIIFLKTFIHIIRKLTNHIVENKNETIAARNLGEAVEDVQAFLTEASIMTDQRNINSLHIDPNLKYRFWCCVAKAHQLRILYSEKNLPNTPAILRICKDVIDLGNKESIQAMACPVRYEPYVICLEGATKIGKSFMMQDVIPEFLADKEVYNIKTYDSPIFVRTPGVEFWNGYRNQPCVLYDDFMAVNSPEIATKQVVELFNLKSSAIMNMNMAHLDEKALRGNPFLVALCANNAFVTVNGTTDPRAFLRRKDAVWKVELDPKYKSITQVPDEIKKTYKHLSFRKYKDSANESSIQVKPITFEQWKEVVKHDLKEYHEQEKKNVKRRMEKLKVLLPETANVMLAETDPFHIFYAAYVQGAEDPTLIQNGLLPSEVVQSQLDLVNSMRNTRTNQTVLQTIDSNEETPNTSDAQIPGFGWLRNLQDRIYNLLFQQKWNVVPNNHFSCEIIKECIICSEEKKVHSWCESKHPHCETCIMRMRAASRLDNVQFSCAMCRQDLNAIHYDPDLYSRYFILSLYLKQSWQTDKRMPGLEKARAMWHSIITDPRFPSAVWAGIAALLLGGFTSILSEVRANNMAGEIASENLDMMIRNPFYPIRIPTVCRWGPVWWCATEKEPYWSWDNRRESFFENYINANYDHNKVIYGFAQMPVPNLEEWSHLQQPRSKFLKRYLPDNTTVVVANSECPHKRLCYDSAQYDDENLSGWYYNGFEPTVIPDAPCQYDDCPWKDPKVRHNFLNNWANDHPDQILEEINNYNRVKIEWRLPEEFVEEIVITAKEKALNEVKEKIGITAKKSSWFTWVPKWETMWKWLKVASAMIGAMVACIGGLAFMDWLNKGSDSQITNSGSFQNKRLAGHSKILKRVSAQFSPEKQNSCIRSIERNTVFINVAFDVGKLHREMSLRCIGLFDRCIVLPKHYGLWLDSYINRVEQGKYQNGKLQIQMYYKKDVISDFHLTKGQIKYTDNECAFLWLPKQIPIFKDLLHWIPTEKEHNALAGNYLHVQPQRETQSTMVVKGKIMDRLDTLTIRAIDEFAAYDTFNAYEVTHGGKGCCGSAYLSEQEHPFFAIHIAGENSSVNVGYGIALVREDLERIKQGTVTLSTWEPKLRSPLDAQMFLDGAILPMGCVERKQIAFCPEKSKIIPSLVNGKIEDTPINTQPGILSGKDPRYKHDGSPLYWGCMKHTNPPKDFDPIVLEMAVEGVQHDIIRNMKPLRNLSTELTLEESVSGFKDLPFYDTIDLSTSSGWPWNCDQRKRKDEWITYSRGKDGFIENIKFDPQLEQVMKVKDEQRSRGIKPLTVFLDWLKDERRKEKKINMKDGTRIFSLSPVDFTIQQRQLTLDFAASFMHYRERLEHAVGMSEDGEEWSRLAHHLLKKSNHIVTGDYSDFGPRLSATIVYAAYQIMQEWYEMNGEKSEINKTKRLVMAEEVANCVHLMRDFMYTALCGSPSGSCLTVIVNSLVNMIYIRYIWLYIHRGHPDGTHDKFKENVALKVYGDDLIMAVTEHSIDRFNCVTVGGAFRKLDIIFTDAGKTGLEKYTTLDKATFLKRGFLKHPLREYDYLAPLDIISIQDCAQWVWKSNSIEESTRLNCEQSLLLAYGHGQKFFNQWKKKLNQAMTKQGLETLTTNWHALDKIFFGYSDIDEGYMIKDMEQEIHDILIKENNQSNNLITTRGVALILNE